MVLKTYSMQDTGTRLEHMADLQDLWSTGLAILTSGTYHSFQEQQEARELEIALRLLEHHMVHDYSTIETSYAKIINDLPKKAGEIT